MLLLPSEQPAIQMTSPSVTVTSSLRSAGQKVRLGAERPLKSSRETVSTVRPFTVTTTEAAPVTCTVNLFQSSPSATKDTASECGEREAVTDSARGWPMPWGLAPEP